MTSSFDTSRLEQHSVFYNNLVHDLKTCAEECPQLNEFLETKFGITDVMSVEFDDLSTKSASDIDFRKSRGNTQLMQGKVFVQNDTDKLFNKIEKFEF